MVAAEPHASDQQPSTLGELLLALSRVTSAGLGLGVDHGLRTCYLSMAIAEELALPAEQRSALYYLALAKDAGCSCGANQMAQFLDSDDREALADLLHRDTESGLDMLRWIFRHTGRGRGPGARARRVLAVLVHGQRFEHEAALEECEVAQRLAVRLGLGEESVAALGTCTERWDGKGQPRGLIGEAIPLMARIVNLAAAAEIAWRLSDVDAAVELVHRRSGKAFDPTVAEAFLTCASREGLWEEPDADDLSARLIALEPEGADAARAHGSMPSPK